ncbi:MAG: 3-deoxy-manno-octulosonate cytidylyltransferase [Nitrospinae bacterium]|nr:3-deoxy-manno-octulosonate cytidylyltransferase [Nitrospinota bacterium]MBL7019904.1 3-deoxy-manno-octulosonate cytidylyltransferase [Nitrospinaceae bacterium]
MPADLKVIAVIPARWASSRFPGKPLALIQGKPMIQRVFEQAKKAKSVSEVIVATDDSRILEAVSKFGGNAVMTSPDHESGTDRIAEVVRDKQCDIVVNVQGDEPLIPPANIDLIVRPLLDGVSQSTVTLRILIKTCDELMDRNITKVVVDKSDSALYFSKAPIPWDRDGGDTNVNLLKPFWYKHIGLYAYRKNFLMEFGSLPDSRLEKIEKLEQLRILENGYSIKVVETDMDSIGVDCEADIAMIEERLAE